MRGWTLGSGSRGNALVLESAGHYLLVDCGFGPRTLAKRLQLIGVDPEAIEGLVLTHEHQDHADGAARAQHKWRWPVYASAGTLAALPKIEARWRRPLTAGAMASARADTGAFQLEGVAVPHDARAPLAYAITATATGERVGIAHDLGAVPDALPALFARCDALCIEANHDREMLRTGPYPPALQARIRGGRGHLDNATTGTLVASLAHRGLRHVVLLHLSETNNTPAMAEAAVTATVRRAGCRGVVRAAPGRAPAAVFGGAGDAMRAVGQLALAL
ncbi:MAG: MBL fold metallo-hydrolase [Gemmatimonadaceae bacterium]